jgi:hypothetical protein
VNSQTLPRELYAGRIAGLVLAVCVLTAGCAYNIEESHFFLPGPAKSTAPSSIGDAIVENVTLRAADGTTLAGAYVARPGADLEVLYFGGNASRVDDAVAEIFGSPW